MIETAVAPCTDKTAFSCPHCSALTTQYWRGMRVTFRSSENSAPFRIRDLNEETKFFLSDMPSGESRDSFEQYLDRLAVGLQFIEGKYEKYTEIVQNADVSECYNCKKLAFWLGDELVWPSRKDLPTANIDMPDHIKRDFHEAGEIAGKSPRGAAALLRLCVQKLCIELGQSGKNINDDIAAMVKNGLDPRVQKMLDVVRVIGNNAVHPGELDIRDNREIVNQLFKLVNMIVDAMISQPKAIEALYGELGPNARSAIARRDDG
jgi:hypothetical protein